MNRRKALVSFLTVAMLLCGLLVLPPAWATSSDWSKPRPSGYTLYDKTIGNSKTDDVASIEMGVHIGQYSENDPAYDYNDHLSLKVSASANTRVGIQYAVLPNDYDWCEVFEPTNITSDNDGTWLYPEFTFLYYGVEYYRIWVCSNGFLTLNKTCTNANPQNIPSTDEPNPVIAVFWRDLHFGEGSSITYGRDIEFNNEEYFVVSWNKVLDDSGTPQTFQVLIQHRQGWDSSDYHNKIFFQYKNITKSYPTTVGTEDQVGNKGTAYDYNNLHNEACLKFDYFILGYRLERLKIKLTKDDSYAKIDFLRTYIGGYNVILKEYENPFGDTFKAALMTAASLALLEAGIMWNVMLITAEFAGALAGDLSRPYADEEHIKDGWENDNEAWAWAQCVIENRSIIYCKPFDSTLATTVEWSFTDDANNKDHDLTVTAEAWYRDLSNDIVYIISASSTLNMYIGKTLSISASSGGTTNPAPGTYAYGDGESVTVTAYAYAYHTFDGWILDGSIIVYDNITVTMDSDHTLDAYFSVSGGGDGGGGEPCPTLFVWNGSAYVDYGVIDIHNPSGEDVVREVPVQAEDVGISNYKAKFRLREGWEGLNFSESVIDQVKLYAVGKNGNRYQCPLIKATHSTLGKVLPQLLLSDDYRVQILLLEMIDLEFAVPYKNVQGYTFTIEGCNKWKM
jgi:hypothetical protein